MTKEIVANQAVADHIRDHGGALYVWPVKAPCCGGMTDLRASTEKPEKAFRRIDAPGFELYLTAGMATPESLHLEVGRRGRVRAFWNGLAWVA